MRVVVTGATSFLGTATVRQLLQKGHQVYAVVRPESKNILHLWDNVPEEHWSAMQIIELDLCEIETISTQILPFDLEKRPCDIWIHMGWEGAGSGNRVKRDVQQSNVQNSLAAVRAAAEIGCGRFLFTGSQAEYGIHHQIITEETACRPVSEYGIAKANFAVNAEKLCRTLGVEYIHARIFSVYGPGDHPWSLVQSCLRTWQQAGHMELGECTQKWNFLYIEDVVSAFVHLLTEGKPGIYNVAGDDTRILREFVEEMYALCGSQGTYAYGRRMQNAEGAADLIPDISKICGETGWRPATLFGEGIYETLRSLRERTA